MGAVRQTGASMKQPFFRHRGPVLLLFKNSSEVGYKQHRPLNQQSCLVGVKEVGSDGQGWRVPSRWFLVLLGALQKMMNMLAVLRMQRLRESDHCWSLERKLLLLGAGARVLSKRALKRSFSVSAEGMVFLLKPRMRTGLRTFSSLFRWSLLICFTIFSYQSDSSGGSFIFRDTCSSSDSFTANTVLPNFFFSCMPVPSRRFSCWLSWKSRKANFLDLVAFQSFYGRNGSSIYYSKNQLCRIWRIKKPASSPPWLRTGRSKNCLIGSAYSSPGARGICSIVLSGNLRCTSSRRLISLYLISRLSSSALSRRWRESRSSAEEEGSCMALRCLAWYCLALRRSPRQQCILPISSQILNYSYSKPFSHAYSNAFFKIRIPSVSIPIFPQHPAKPSSASTNIAVLSNNRHASLACSQQNTARPTRSVMRQKSASSLIALRNWSGRLQSTEQFSSLMITTCLPVYPRLILRIPTLATPDSDSQITPPPSTLATSNDGGAHPMPGDSLAVGLVPPAV